MSKKEYLNAIKRMCEIIKILNYKLDDEGLDLFEEYCTLCEETIKVDMLCL